MVGFTDLKKVYRVPNLDYFWTVSLCYCILDHFFKYKRIKHITAMFKRIKFYINLRDPTSIYHIFKAFKLISKAFYLKIFKFYYATLVKLYSRTDCMVNVE